MPGFARDATTAAAARPRSWTSSYPDMETYQGESALRYPDMSPCRGADLLAVEVAADEGLDGFVGVAVGVLLGG